MVNGNFCRIFPGVAVDRRGGQIKTVQRKSLSLVSPTASVSMFQVLLSFIPPHVQQNTHHILPNFLNLLPSLTPMFLSLQPINPPSLRGSNEMYIHPQQFVLPRPTVLVPHPPLPPHLLLHHQQQHPPAAAWMPVPPGNFPLNRSGGPVVAMIPSAIAPAQFDLPMTMPMPMPAPHQNFPNLTQSGNLFYPPQTPLVGRARGSGRRWRRWEPYGVRTNRSNRDRVSSCSKDSSTKDFCPERGYFHSSFIVDPWLSLESLLRQRKNQNT